MADVQGNVDLIRRQILIAGALGLLLALAGGFVVSRSMARRVRSLERGAGQVAGGDFTAVFPVDKDDELGQLARALDDMQRQLAQLETARRRFIATASHELRTPIFSIGGFLELMEDEELDDETRRQFVATVREQVERLGKLATDLLDLSRLEAGSLELRPEPTDLGELTRTVTAEFTPALEKHDSTIDVRLGGERIEAVCDPERVAQVLRILIDNALTHTPSGTGVVVSAVRENGAVRLAVSDDGPGISDAAAQRVFEPFFTSDDEQGSGPGPGDRARARRADGRLARRRSGAGPDDVLAGAAGLSRRAGRSRLAVAGLAALARRWRWRRGGCGGSNGGDGAAVTADSDAPAGDRRPDDDRRDRARRGRRRGLRPGAHLRARRARRGDDPQRAGRRGERHRRRLGLRRSTGAARSPRTRTS